MHSDYEKLSRRLNTTPYLVANVVTKDVELIPEADAIRLLVAGDGAPFPRRFLVNLKAALDGFSALPSVGSDDRTFGLAEVALIMGCGYHLTYNLSKTQGIFRPTIRDFRDSTTGPMEVQFSYLDAFIAGCIGCLHRAGFCADVLRKIQPLLSGQAKAASQRERLIL